MGQDASTLPAPLGSVDTQLLVLQHMALWESSEEGVGPRPLLSFQDLTTLTGARDPYHSKARI